MSKLYSIIIEDCQDICPFFNSNEGICAHPEIGTHNTYDADLYQINPHCPLPDKD